MTDLESLVEDLLGLLDEDNQGNKLVPVWCEELGTYEVYPVSEELLEILVLLEKEIRSGKSQEPSSASKRKN